MDMRIVCLCVTVTLLGSGVSGRTAYCRIEKNSGTGAVEGNITLTQQVASSNVSITVSLSGFEVTSGEDQQQPASTKHGFHVHQYGRLGDSCSDAGAHFNPFNKTHGAPSDDERHVGDLGNVLVSSNGSVETTITDHLVTLFGPLTVIGRSFVVHEDEDDLGRGDYEDSSTTGHAGARLGCCIIRSRAAAVTVQSVTAVYSSTLQLIMAASCLLAAGLLV